MAARIPGPFLQQLLSKKENVPHVPHGTVKISFFLQQLAFSELTQDTSGLPIVLSPHNTALPACGCDVSHDGTCNL